MNENCVEIRMPQMSNKALSENWLLKYMGDIHWQLIFDELKCVSSAMKDAFGNRIYPVFTRLKYATPPLSAYSENEVIHFKSNIHEYESNIHICHINGSCSGNFIAANLMTSLSLKSTDQNTSLEKCNRLLESNNIPKLRSMPEFLCEYNSLKDNALSYIAADKYKFHITQEAIYTTTYEPNKYYDINGTGLLYFAAYPIISDICFDRYYGLNLLQTTYRDVHYYANIDCADKIIFKLNMVEVVCDKVMISSTLVRQIDKKIIARIFTIKQKVN